MTNNVKGIIIGLGAILVLLALLVTKYGELGPALGGATPGTAARVATTSTITIANSASAGEILLEEVLFNGGTGSGVVTNQCATRIITTRATPILINFSGISTSTATTTFLSAMEGHLQAASTTVVYDGSLYGCGYWGARSAGGATSTISVTETQ